MAISKSYVRTKIRFLLLLFSGVIHLCWTSTSQNETSFADQIRNYQSQLETNPNQVEIRLALARTYLLFEAFEQAMAEYQRIIEIDPKRANGYFGLGLSLARSLTNPFQLTKVRLTFLPIYRNIMRHLVVLMRNFTVMIKRN